MNKIISIHHKIYIFRGRQIMLDSDRFPDDFMFQLSEDEFQIFKVTICDLKFREKGE